MAPFLVEAAIKSLILVLLLLTGFAYLTLAERKLIADFQARIGPNRAGPYGLLQPLADAVKLFFKEDFIPEYADRVLFVLAPLITLIPTLLIFAVIPFGPELTLFGYRTRLQLTDVHVGVLYIVAVTSISVYGITLAGWASNNKYALLGGIRASAQMISYELAMGLAIVSVVLTTGTLQVSGIVEAQRNGWLIFLQPVAAVIFFITGLAEIKRAPFDLVEAEQELTAGYLTEYSSMKFALFFMSEYVKMIGFGALMTTFFLGGYLGPFVDLYPGLGVVYFTLKVGFLIFVLIWLRATLPRIRYDQLMSLGWKVLLPLSLANVMGTAVVVALTA
ncbi:NADH-quinone oxidoreductase subunit NuoH [Thermoflexus sp.]|uniref:NADH-quinone oxidoreductase subunit NuoH n=1 Tax=Thermoflexus sp. TaxID=1969742 RepID=UPI0025F524ED|nr:NADH-quinone oxidoreductase subunit NuoH [Thermoflexus sp.]MCS6965023.1 NADH-quinone oxidoreductase subunit NuoH [Thermoflexus sp.]MCX7691102.1 NADH-quinone oxidoreductase subunit NuoH [Thermoflexus sp.]MDW8184376.1 NADH-quinone oxidoreductase subunit NuoH [Anaerolineae bacterium]